jgi:hypothetical protein
VNAGLVIDFTAQHTSPFHSATYFPISLRNILPHFTAQHTSPFHSATYFPISPRNIFPHFTAQHNSPFHRATSCATRFSISTSNVQSEILQDFELTVGLIIYELNDSYFPLLIFLCCWFSTSASICVLRMSNSCEKNICNL